MIIHIFKKKREKRHPQIYKNDHVGIGRGKKFNKPKGPRKIIQGKPNEVRVMIIIIPFLDPNCITIKENRAFFLFLIFFVIISTLCSAAGVRTNA